MQFIITEVSLKKQEHDICIVTLRAKSNRALVTTFATLTPKEYVLGTQLTQVEVMEIEALTLRTIKATL
jgi:hypothetical protein